MIPTTVMSLHANIALRCSNYFVQSNVVSQRICNIKCLALGITGSTRRYFCADRMEAPYLSRTEVRKMKVQELKDALNKRGLDPTGLRADLMNRLLVTIPHKRSFAKKKSSVNIIACVSENVDIPHDDSSIPSHENTIHTTKIEYKDASDSETHILSPTATYILQFDGGSRGNPGVSGAGMVLYDETGEEVWHGRHFVGEMSTNNVAEYSALLVGLQCARMMGANRVIIQGDSELVIKQILGVYRCKDSKLKPYYISSKTLLKEFKSWEINHIDRAQNSRADALANDAMDWFDSNYMHQFLNPSMLGLK